VSPNLVSSTLSFKQPNQLKTKRRREYHKGDEGHVEKLMGDENDDSGDIKIILSDGVEIVQVKIHNTVMRE
jgi:hypothetical protein